VLTNYKEFVAREMGYPNRIHIETGENEYPEMKLKDLRSDSKTTIQVPDSTKSAHNLRQFFLQKQDTNPSVGSMLSPKVKKTASPFFS